MSDEIRKEVLKTVVDHTYNTNIAIPISYGVFMEFPAHSLQSRIKVPEIILSSMSTEEYKEYMGVHWGPEFGYNVDYKLDQPLKSGIQTTKYEGHVSGFQYTILSPANFFMMHGNPMICPYVSFPLGIKVEGLPKEFSIIAQPCNHCAFHFVINGVHEVDGCLCIDTFFDQSEYQHFRIEKGEPICTIRFIQTWEAKIL